MSNIEVRPGVDHGGRDEAMPQASPFSRDDFGLRVRALSRNTYQPGLALSGLQLPGQSSLLDYALSKRAEAQRIARHTLFDQLGPDEQAIVERYAAIEPSRAFGAMTEILSEEKPLEPGLRIDRTFLVQAEEEAVDIAALHQKAGVAATNYLADRELTGLRAGYTKSEWEELSLWERHRIKRGARLDRPPLINRVIPKFDRVDQLMQRTFYRMERPHSTGRFVLGTLALASVAALSLIPTDIGIHEVSRGIIPILNHLMPGYHPRHAQEHITHILPQLRKLGAGAIRITQS